MSMKFDFTLASSRVEACEWLYENGWLFTDEHEWSLPTDKDVKDYKLEEAVLHQNALDTLGKRPKHALGVRLAQLYIDFRAQSQLTPTGPLDNVVTSLEEALMHFGLHPYEAEGYVEEHS